MNRWSSPRTHRRLHTLLAPWTTPLDPSVFLRTFLPRGGAVPEPTRPIRSLTPDPLRPPTIRWGASATVGGSVDETILDTLEAHGVEATFGCRRGVCRRCIVPLVEGCVRDQRDERDIAAGTHVRICVTSPLADVTLDPAPPADRTGLDDLTQPIPSGVRR